MPLNSRFAPSAGPYMPITAEFGAQTRKPLGRPSGGFYDGFFVEMLMDTKWFSNHGQKVQTIFGGIAAIIGLCIWLAVPPASALLYIGPVLVTGGVLWLFFSLGRLVGFRPPPPQVPQAPSPIDELLTSVTRKTPPILITPVSLKIGDRWEKKFDYGADIRIILHQIRKIEDKEEYQADVEFDRGTGPMCGGPNTIRSGAARFWMMRTRHLEINEGAVYAFDIRENYCKLIIFYLDHINAHAQSVQGMLCVVDARSL
jgi:hypothetical protein